MNGTIEAKLFLVVYWDVYIHMFTEAVTFTFCTNE